MKEFLKKHSSLIQAILFIVIGVIVFFVFKLPCPSQGRTAHCAVMSFGINLPRFGGKYGNSFPLAEALEER